jgi:GT2 family glycosyltransferase
MPPDVSVCLVTLNTRDYLRQCLVSLFENTHVELEVFVVDNASSDGTVEMLRQEFPGVQVIRNSANLGYTHPNNQALRRANGRYLMLLNPDTILHKGSVDALVAFMDGQPQAGICGPKILNSDGTFQEVCRRGVARPWNTISYFLRLHRLFPGDPRFGGYLLTHLDEDQTAEVDGLSGACMLIRREVVNQIGYLDEDYFAYQEDADYCFRAQAAGWKVMYYPAARVTHFGGKGGTRVQPYRSIYEWHRSYWLFYRKNLAQDYFFLFNGLYYALMGVKLLFSLGVNLFRREKFAGPRRG